MHLGFDSQPNLTRFFLTFHPKTHRSFTTLSLRCVSIASQLVAAKIVGTETGASNLETWFIHGKGCWLDGRNFRGLLRMQHRERPNEKRNNLKPVSPTGLIFAYQRYDEFRCWPGSLIIIPMVLHFFMICECWKHDEFMILQAKWTIFWKIGPIKLKVNLPKMSLVWLGSRMLMDIADSTCDRYMQYANVLRKSEKKLQRISSLKIPENQRLGT